MDASLRFLLAAKHAEIRVLEQLAQSCDLVSKVGEFVHRLQRERGASSMFLASGQQRFHEQLRHHRDDCDIEIEKVLVAFAGLRTESASTLGDVRLFSRIAYVVHGIDAIPGLREAVDRCTLSPDQSAASYGDLIGGLMGVVFEAADAATDPDISGVLVAMFNFMQGKELAGQERAAGVAGFAMGRFDSDRQQRLANLIDNQQRYFDIFSDFAASDIYLLWQNLVSVEEHAEILRLRSIALASQASDAPLRDVCDRWFELQTARIDGMKRIETALTERLSALCQAKVDEAGRALNDHERILAALAAPERPSKPSVAVLFANALNRPRDDAQLAPDFVIADGLSPELGRSVLELLQEQAQRIQRIGDELSAARTVLNERKLIERGKGVLMAHHGITEDQAHRLMRETAMDQGKRLVEVAESVLSLGKLLQPKTRSRR